MPNSIVAVAKAMAHIITVGWVCALSTLTGCSGGSSSPSQPAPPPPPSPVTLTFTLSTTDLYEEDGNHAIVEISAASPVTRVIQTSLSFTGDAELDQDFEVDSASTRIGIGSQSVQTRIHVLKDWQVEETETLTIEVSSTAESVTIDTGPIEILVHDSGVGPVTKDQFTSFAFVSADLNIGSSLVEVEANLWNVGREQLEASRLVMFVSESPYYGTSRQTNYQASVPSLNVYGFYSNTWSIPLRTLRASRTYYIQVAVVGRNNNSRLSGYSRDWLGFELDANRRVVVSCDADVPDSQEGIEDPLFVHQWSLQNSGQNAFASSGGVPDADLSMDTTLNIGEPTGDGVKIAVVDTGLEVCHPDLADNVEPTKSFNFKSSLVRSNSWFGATPNDPYQAATYGDHGTAVGGIIAAKGNNGIGLRGVAPDALIRGFNFLTEQCCMEDALGASSIDPMSDDVDIFNLSWGSAFGSASELRSSLNSLYRTMTTTLRDGKGAIYVKSAGNAFNGCFSMRHDAHQRLGCNVTNNEDVQVLPYLIVVGALNADDERATYSSTGSTIWVSAPAGQYGNSSPASITTDQIGTDRGYDQISRRGLALDSISNDNGNYISTFNGTSAAAPHTSGAVALLLEREPRLTWRDVKHVLAYNARVVQPNIQSERVTIGGVPVTLLDAWEENSAGYHYHNYFGFGAVDVDASLSMLEDYVPDSLGEFVESDWFESEISEPQDIPDEDGAGISFPVVVGPGGLNNNVETVWVQIEVSHEFPADLALILSSPSGTRSVMNHPLNNGLVNQTGFTWTLGSNAFYGEDPDGTWTLQVIDTVAGDTGSVDKLEIKVFSGDH